MSELIFTGTLQEACDKELEKFKKPDLTFIWNEAAQLANNKKISVYRMNEVWGALRTLEKQGFCQLAESTYD